MPGKPGVPFFWGRGNWIAGFRDFKSMGNPATTQQVGCRDATFGGDVVGGAPWNPPGASWGVKSWDFFGFSRCQNPKQIRGFFSLKTNSSYPLKMDGWKMKSPFKTVPFQETC